MISYNRFYELFHELFCYPNYLNSYGFNPSFSTSSHDISALTFNGRFFYNHDNNGQVFWWSEEPINQKDFEDLHYYSINSTTIPFSVEMHGIGTNSLVPRIRDIACDVDISIIANSEKSQLKKNLFKKYQYFDWYFFFHGYAALDWFRDFKYLNQSVIKIDKLFICLNHLLTNNRSYRLNLLNELKKNELDNRGYVSAPNLSKDIIKQEVFNPYTRLSDKSKRDIFNNLYPTAQPMILDKYNDLQVASADIADYIYSLSSLWNIVTETVFYDNKLHLTEKIFKPIVLKRPFMLVSAPGNLKYLKEYGFQTFDKWINEDYDNELDPDIRIKKIVNELSRIKNNNLEEMYYEMKPVLEFNHNHFFGKFKELIVDETIDNYKKCIFMYNRDLSARFRINQSLDYNQIKNILLRN